MRQDSVTIPAAVLGDPCEGGDENKALVPIQGSVGSHQWGLGRKVTWSLETVKAVLNGNNTKKP